MVIEVSDQTFETEVIKCDMPVVVDFWAPWCGPCRMIAPVMEKLSEEYADKVKFCKLNVDENPEMSQKYGVKYVDLDTLLSQSDIITLHIPYTPQTHHIINQQTISRMKPRALLINTARGALVDTEALIKALDQGRIGGAALDVIEGNGLSRRRTTSYTGSVRAVRRSSGKPCRPTCYPSTRT